MLGEHDAMLAALRLRGTRPPADLPSTVPAKAFNLLGALVRARELSEALGVVVLVAYPRAQVTPERCAAP